MLPGVSIQDINKRVDERGFFAEILRNDWKNFLGDDKVVQANLSLSYPGMIRAWHRHKRGQVDYLIILEGAMKICAYDDEKGSPTTGDLVEIIASEDKLQLVRVPGHYWHLSPNYTIPVIPTRSEGHGMISVFLTQRHRSHSIGTGLLTHRNHSGIDSSAHS